MREIIFRGNRKDNGESIFGYYFQKQNPFSADGFPITHYISDCPPFGAEVDPETVGQFTGKTDKNGKKVFEHDILQTFTVWADGTVEKGGVGVIQWSENDQCYVLATKEGYHIDDFGNLGRPEYYEVIGNIHDNPDLLEVHND